MCGYSRSAFLLVLKYTTYTSSKRASVGKRRTSASVISEPAMYRD